VNDQPAALIEHPAIAQFENAGIGGDDGIPPELVEAAPRRRRGYLDFIAGTDVPWPPARLAVLCLSRLVIEHRPEALEDTIRHQNGT
jgi:hypothetical protein